MAEAAAGCGATAIVEAIRGRREAGLAAVAPFLTVGDPDCRFTVECLAGIDSAGAAVCELGVPYSDPIADGPVIQASYTRALAAGGTLADTFDVARQTAASLTMPLVAMTSYSIIFRRGIDSFTAEARAAGLAGLVVPDLPLEESATLAAACREHGLALVRLVTPTTPPERAARIAAESTGFLYCVSVAGVTGERAMLPEELVERVAWLRQRCEVPIMVGFGIRDATQVRAVCEVADGAIVGSAVVRQLARCVGGGEGGREEVLAAIREQVAGLVNATRSRGSP